MNLFSDDTRGLYARSRYAMYTLPGLICLVVYLLVRPFYFVPALRSIPFLYIFFALAVLGFVIDLSSGRLRGHRGPHLPWVIALVLWAHVTLVVRSPESLGGDLELILSPLVFFLMAHGVASLKDLSRLTSTFLFCTVFVSLFCVYQGLQPLQCVEFLAETTPLGADILGVPTGYPCADSEACYDALFERGYSLRCEHVGPAHFQSVTGRVRYVGVLADPNETALTVSLGIPIAIVRFQSRRSLWRLLVLALTLGLGVAAVIFTKSRGGQLVFLTILAVYFVSRYRLKGLSLAALMALPVLLLGGRSGQEAEQSSDGRLAVQANGLDMFRDNLIFGVGHGQYGQYSTYTAHNSFVFAPAELGFLGLVLWATVLWISVKVVLVPFLRLSPESDPEVRRWAMALLAILLGISVGIAFLTFNFHYVLWTVFGLAGAYYRIASTITPEVKVRIGWKDVAFATAANLAVLLLLAVTLKVTGIR